MNIKLTLSRKRTPKLTNKEKKLVATIMNLGFQAIPLERKELKEEFHFVFTDEKFKKEVDFQKEIKRPSYV